MNRVLIFGVAIFFAVVGIALMGGESKAVAGGCGGCYAEASCDSECGGGHCCGLFARWKARKHHRCGGLFGHKKHGCCAPEPTCCEPAPAPSCCEPAPAPCCEPAPTCGGAPVEAAPAAPAAEGEATPPPAPAPSASLKPYGFRQVSFRR